MSLIKKKLKSLFIPLVCICLIFALVIINKSLNASANATMDSSSNNKEEYYYLLPREL